METNAKSKPKPYKYKINLYLTKLPHDKYKLTLNKLHLALEVGKTTFNDWRYLKEDDTRDIAFCKLMMIADFFGVKPSAMFTTPPKKINYNSLKKINRENHAQKFNVK